MRQHFCSNIVVVKEAFMIISRNGKIYDVYMGHTPSLVPLIIEKALMPTTTINIQTCYAVVVLICTKYFIREHIIHAAKLLSILMIYYVRQHYIAGYFPIRLLKSNMRVR